MAERARGPVLLAAALLLAAGTLAASEAARDLAPARWLAAMAHPDLTDMAEVVFAYAALPRAAAALACGAALGLGAALFGLALRNPLAVPDTLGVVGGAQLALATLTLWAPWTLAAIGRGPAAFTGGALAAALALAAASRGGLKPGLLLPAGLATSFYASALATLLLLFDAHDLSGLSAWSGGSLAVQDWSPLTGVVLSLGAATVAVALLRRPLALLDMDDASARALGLAVWHVRLAALLVGVALTAAVTGVFGPLGFVGVGGTLLARTAGARRPGQRLAWSALIGAGLLWLADGMATAAEPLVGAPLATGSATALVGVPLLLAAAARADVPLVARASEPTLAAPVSNRATLAGLAAGLAAALALALLVGRDASGWHVDIGPALAAAAPWRAPRTFGAAAAGASLAVSGALLQRVTANPLAGPDMLGLGAGAALGLLAGIVLGFGSTASAALAFGGAAAAGIGVLLWSLRGGFSPSRLVVVGLSLGSCAEALLGAFAATGDPRATALLAWAAGSTSRATAGEVIGAWLALGGCALAALLLRRPLDLLGLGTGPARALGLRVGPAGFAVCITAAVAAGAGTALVGPFSFVGLLAPQAAARLGLVRVLPQAAGAGLIGALVMVLADAAGRTVDAPWQVPCGLMAAILGGPALLLRFAWGRR